jgi:hypothetical protein
MAFLGSSVAGAEESPTKRVFGSSEAFFVQDASNTENAKTREKSGERTTEFDIGARNFIILSFILS